MANKTGHRGCLHTFTDSRGAETRSQAALGHDYKCITNSVECNGKHGTGDLAYHRGSRKTFLEEVTASRSETGEVEGGRSVSGSARAKAWRPVRTLSTQGLAGIQSGCVSSDRW